MTSKSAFSIQDLVKTYQYAAMGSLKGPKDHLPSLSESAEGGESSYGLSEWRRALEISRARARPQREGYDSNCMMAGVNPQPPPVFLSVDDGPCTLSSVFLDGHQIDCFDKGGEKRLCLPTVLCTLLSGVDETVAQKACDKLQLNMPRCSRMQLEVLKKYGALPARTQSCGLITLSDAERLYSQVKNCGATSSSASTEKSFAVYHECFGICTGTLIPELYTNPQAPCIKCKDCEKLFSPEKFVRHTHSDTEDGMCHWGFDSHKWRSYLLIDDDQEDEALTRRFLELKDKFLHHPLQSRKRATSCSVRPVPFLPSPKVRKLNKSVSEDLTACGVSEEDLKRLQCSGPPKLLDPQKVVPFSEQDKYDKSFIPNVCLAPNEDGKKLEEDDDDDDDEDEVVEDVITNADSSRGAPCPSSSVGSSGSISRPVVCHMMEGEEEDGDIVATLRQLISQVTDVDLKTQMEAAHAQLAHQRADKQRECVMLSQSLQLNQRELVSEHESKVCALQDLSRLNKDLWAEMAQKTQKHLSEKKDLEEKISGLQSYVKDVFAQKEKRYEEACQQFREKLFRYETQLMLVQPRSGMSLQTVHASEQSNTDKTGHEHYIKRLIRSSVCQEGSQA